MTSDRPPRIASAIRRRRMGTREIQIQTVAPARSLGSGTLRSLSGFAVLLAVGTLLLMVPAATVEGRSTEPIEALFTAVSAMCVTGHVIHETQLHWSFFGEVVILLLIQIGGLGYMMGTTVLLWALGRQMGMRDRQLLRLYYGAPSMGETLSFARTIGLYTLAIEGMGAIVLFFVFLGDGREIQESLWWSVFHSVSAFNNAGFSITGADIVPYREDPVVLLTLSFLVILGGLGAVPVLALARRRSWDRLPLDNKLIFLMTGILLAGGMAAYLALEWRNAATLGTVDAAHRPLLAFFQATMPRTAGFSAVPVIDLNDETKFLTIALMFIGGAAGSTAGGVKVGTFALLFVAILATFRGRDEAIILRRKIPERIIRQSIVIALSAIAVVVGFTFSIVLASGDEEFLDVMFDTVSALGTVGLITGPASRGSDLVHLLYILAMLVGRFGPLVLVLEMNKLRRRSTFKAPEDSIRLG
jgi:trk system potassium uptake protein TrkH